MKTGNTAVTNSESSARLRALEPKVLQLAETDPAFERALINDPLKAIRAHFGDEAMPNEGEHLRPSADGGSEMVFPKTNVAWKFAAPTDELPDELLEFAGGDNSPDCGTNAGNIKR
jgi:hypothetical protein